MFRRVSTINCERGLWNFVAVLSRDIFLFFVYNIERRDIVTFLANVLWYHLLVFLRWALALLHYDCRHYCYHPPSTFLPHTLLLQSRWIHPFVSSCVLFFSFQSPRLQLHMLQLTHCLLGTCFRVHWHQSCMCLQYHQG